MPQLPIQLPYRNADQYAILNNLYLAQDCFLVALGGGNYTIHKKPGQKEYAYLGHLGSIDGCFWFNEIKALIVCSDSNVYKFTDKFATMTQIGTNILEKNTRVTFCKVTDSADGLAVSVVMANGGNMVKTKGTTCTKITGSNIPTRVTHVASIDTYLICNDLDNPNSWRTSNVGTPFNFTTPEIFIYSAQGLTDKINGLFQLSGSIWITGENSIEPFYDSGQDIPFLRITGGLIETGLVNPYSITPQLGIYLNTNRNIKDLSGNVLSEAYANRIQTLSSINDVEVDYIGGIDGKKFVLFNFNDAHITIVYDVDLKCFYEWGSWDEENNQYNQFNGRCYCYCPDWNMHIIGDRNNGKLYELSTEFTSDDGNPIRTEIITGNYSPDMSNMNNQFRSTLLHTRRGDGMTSDNLVSPKAYVQYRINFQPSWSNQIELDLGSIGQVTTQDPQLESIMFNTIQFRILHMDDSKFVLNGIYVQ